MDVERRLTVEGSEIEYREEGGTPVLRGYAAVFQSESRDLGGFRESILPTAFDEVLRAQPDVLGLYNHDRNWLLARSSNGSLRLSRDGHGLRYEMHLPETRMAQDVREMVKNRLVTGSSFAFAVKKNGGDSWCTDSNGMRKREIRSVGLLEDVGPVVRPAYDASSVVVSRRALEMALGENYRPNQTMANSARRGLRIAEKRDDIDVSVLHVAERIANRDILTLEDVEIARGAMARATEARAASWSGTTPHVEWMLCGGDSGESWYARRSEPSAVEPEGSGSVPAEGDAAVEPPADATEAPAEPPCDSLRDAARTKMAELTMSLLSTGLHGSKSAG